MKPPRSILLVLMAMAVIGLGACENRTPVGETDTTQWAKFLKPPKADFTPDEQLEVVTWEGTIPQEVYDFFTRTYGTKIVPTRVYTNEELFDLLQENPEKYDVLTPSDYMVAKMIASGLLHRLNHDNLPNMETIDEDLGRVQYDRGLLYCVPLFRSTIGIAFNVDYVSGIPRRGKFIINQLSNAYLIHRVGVTKEMRFAMGLSLMLLGYSPNTVNPDEIDKARDRLIDFVQNKGVALMGKEGEESLVNNEILLGVVWNGIAAAAWHRNFDIRFILPEGPTLVAIDNAVISVKSKRTRTAELFVNYLLIPQVMAKMTNYNYNLNSISASLAFVDRNVHNSPGFLFPDEENRIFLRDLGENSKLYEDAWAQVLRAKPPDSLVKLPLPKGGFFKGDTKTTDFSKQFIEEIQPNQSESP